MVFLSSAALSKVALAFFHGVIISRASMRSLFALICPTGGVSSVKNMYLNNSEGSKMRGEEVKGIARDERGIVRVMMPVSKRDRKE